MPTTSKRLKIDAQTTFSEILEQLGIEEKSFPDYQQLELIVSDGWVKTTTEIFTDEEDDLQC